MKNQKMKIALVLLNGDKELLNANAFKAVKPYVDCKLLINEDKAVWFIEKGHANLQTRFDLSEVVPYALLCFTISGEFESVVISNSAAEGQFEVLQTAAIFVLIPLEVFVNLGRIDHLNFNYHE